MTTRSRLKYESSKDWFPRTDTGNASLMAHLYGRILRFNHRQQRWMIWTRQHWREDKTGRVYQLARTAARVRFRAAVQIDDLEERGKEAKWAVGSENRYRLDAAVALARTTAPLADDGTEWDSNPWLLGVANGTLDLRTGELRPGSPDERISKVAPVEFDSAARCPTFLSFLEKVQPDEGMRRYLKLRAGYILTGSTHEQDVLFFHGEGANGKTTFVNAIMSVLGRDYAKMAAPGLLLRRRFDSHPTEIADLYGARLVVSSELDEGKALNEALVKQLTGNDKLKGRWMHKDFFEFEPTHKIVLISNHMPDISGTDWGIWRRVKLVPWSVQISDDEKDRYLDVKLKAEAPGILNWMVQGCLEYQRERSLTLLEPAVIRTAVEEYRTESNPVEDFLADRCSLDEDSTVRARDFFRSYSDWADDEGYAAHEKLSRTAFGRRMGQRFKKTGKRYYGVTVKHPIQV